MLKFQKALIEKNIEFVLCGNVDYNSPTAIYDFFLRYLFNVNGKKNYSDFLNLVTGKDGKQR